MIHVCFGLRDKTGHYSKFTGTAMLSLFDNTNAEVTVHILHDNTLTQDNREKFAYVAGRYGQHVKFYNVEQLCADKIAEIINSFPAIKELRVGIATFYRFFISQLFLRDIDKIIYLDSDIIVNLNLKELWDIELGNKILAVVPEILNRSDVQKTFPLCREGIVKNDDYFNAGILLINLILFRKEKNIISDWLKILVKNPQYEVFADQETLNYYFSTRTLKLPLKFNRFVDYARKNREMVLEKKIYHFAGGKLNINLNDPFNRLWMEYFMKTPWFDVETISRLCNGFSQNYHQLMVNTKKAMTNISAIMSGKTRAFFTLPQNVEATKKFFLIRGDEEIILAENQESLRKLIDAMKNSQGKKIFFILVPKFPFGILTKAGFVYGKDFLNGLYFLSDSKSSPPDSYPIIQAM